MPKTPSFAELMAPSRRTPKQTPLLSHTDVINGVVDWLLNKSEWRWIEKEMQLPPGAKHLGVYPPIRQADVVAWNRRDREVYIIEAKAHWDDFLRDHKFMEYRQWCHWFAFAVPEELAPYAKLRMEDVPGWYEGVGLLVIPNGGGRRRMIRRPEKAKVSWQKYRSMIEQCAASARSRLVGARMQIAELEWRLEHRPTQ